QTYASIYEILKQNTNLGNYDYYRTSEADDMAAADTAPTSQLLEDYSDTNLQVAGVQEADIIKTDGKYIYALSENYLYIIETDGGQMTLLDKFERAITTENEKDVSSIYMQNLYVVNNRLIVMKSSYICSNSDGEIGIYLYYWGGESTVAEIYDIEDKTDISLVGVFEQDGYYASSRMVGNVLYIVSNYYIYNQIDQNNPETFIPKITCNGETQLVDPDDICVNDNFDSASYVVISAYDTTNGQFLSNKSLLGYSGEIYMNTDNLYVVSSTYESVQEGILYTGYSNSLITKFALNNGHIEEMGNVKVNGTVLNQFSMDEYNGNFRIVTTVNTWSYLEYETDGGTTSTGFENTTYNNLYVINQNMSVVGQIENLAQGETIYSARFDGNTGYVVTFRQVDPLFSIDLSDPTNPVILGELKIPGFSNYLHNYGEDLLFGLGRDADEETGGAGYLKLSMFDVSDNANVTEAHSLIIDGVYYSEASYNHKAILINYERNIIAFPAGDTYMVYSYDAEQGFVEVAVLSLTKDLGYDWYWGSMRGLYIGDVLYVFSDTVMISYDMNNYKEIFSVQLDENSPYYPYILMD
ncbi:MAG TPA: beta-propeller domain-containing protein, partial [Clostridia bacterium]|nr:beta-propeller domain-containing protein [Clostridia bacterium]